MVVGGLVVEGVVGDYPGSSDSSFWPLLISRSPMQTLRLVWWVSLGHDAWCGGCVPGCYESANIGFTEAIGTCAIVRRCNLDRMLGMQYLRSQSQSCLSGCWSQSPDRMPRGRCECREA